MTDINAEHRKGLAVMALASNITRRGATYLWTRRLPAIRNPRDGRGRTVSFSLGTRDPRAAKQIAAIVTAASEEAFSRLRAGMITEAQTILFLRTTAQRQAVKLASLHEIEKFQGAPLDGPVTDRLMGAVYRMAAQFGGDFEISDTTLAAVKDLDLSLSEIEEIRAILFDLQRQHCLKPSRTKLTELLTEVAPGAAINLSTMARAETVYFRAMAAGCLNMKGRFSSDLAADIEIAFGDEDQPKSVFRDRSEPPPPKANTATEEAHANGQALHNSAEFVAVAATPAFTKVHRLVDLMERSIKDKTQKEEWNENAAKQARATVRLFIRITSKDSFEALEQSDLRIFFDRLHELPTVYDRSAADRARSIDELIARAAELDRDEVGLNSASRNRHFTYLRNLLKFARSGGIAAKTPLDLTDFWTKREKRARDQRPAFTNDDLVALFQHPVWTGATLEKPPRSFDLDRPAAAYWVPLIAVFSGMRREEVCGLAVNDVDLTDDVPFFHVQPNSFRELKNEQSKRKIPILPEILRLGFATYVQNCRSTGHGLLFPELQPAAKRALGEQFFDIWIELRDHALPAAKVDGKVFHSFRHWVGSTLFDLGVPTGRRADILGHLTQGETEERYRSVTRLLKKRDALEKLPLVTSHLQIRQVALEPVRGFSPKTKRRKSQ
jgi:integrase